MSVRCFRGNAELAGIDPANRGLAYGDGVFETMRVHGGELPLWPRHLVRLREGARRLAIPLPDDAVLQSHAEAAAAGCEAGVLKLLLTRGSGGRGYSAASATEAEWMLALHPLPAAASDALQLVWCDTPLPVQPLLAGIKHCNRLEQVLARMEVDRAGADEGLLCDTDGQVVSATAANLLVLRGGRWLTPPLERCGVAGVLRGWLLEAGLVTVEPLSRDAVLAADALALCNAVRGILPVGRLGDRNWPPHPSFDELKARLSMAYPMFSRPEAAA